MTWIKCSERMPEDGNAIVLVWDGKEVKPASVMRFLDGKNVFIVSNSLSSDGWSVLSNVTHWQPLPEPPND